MSAEERQDFLQFLSHLLASGRVDGELREHVRATMAEEDRFQQWQGVLEVLERGCDMELFRYTGMREIRGVEHVEFIDLETRRGICVPRPPVISRPVVPRWPGKTYRLPVPLPTSEAALADAIYRFLEEEVRRKMGADLAVVYLVKGEKGPEQIAASHGEGYGIPARFLPEHVDRWALGRGLAVAADDLRRDPELRQWSEGGKLRSVAVLPLISQEEERPLGIMEAWSRRRHHFMEEELGCMASAAQFLADLCANALYLKEQIFRDALTGVYNRRYFDQMLLDTEMLRSRRTGREFAVLLADIDGFKEINDSFGHLAGDQVLRQVARQLCDRVRPRLDIVSRFGGEEFAILLSELTDLEGARVVAERLRREIADFDFSLVIPEFKGKLTISVGGALYRGDPSTTEHTRQLEKQQLLQRADTALYRAKGAGKNCCVFWEDQRILDRPHPDISRVEETGGA